MKKFKKTERVSDVPTDIDNKTVTQASPISAPSFTTTNTTVDLSSVLNQSKANIEATKLPRKRATKAEMEARRASQPSNSFNSFNSGNIQQDFSRFTNLQEKDFSQTTEPLLSVFDRLGSSYVSKKYGVPREKLVIEKSDIAEVCKNLNKPLTVIEAHLGANSNPVTGAYIAVGVIVGSLILQKYLAIEEHKDANHTNG